MIRSITQLHKNTGAITAHGSYNVDTLPSLEAYKIAAFHFKRMAFILTK